MKTPCCPGINAGLAFLIGALLLPARLPAQAVAPAAPTAAELAKYDTNRNGQLDAAEREAMARDAARASASVATSSGGESGEKPLQLSPFTVSTERDVGYFAENTLAGSRLNTNLADLAASITVVTKQQMEDTAAVDINDVFKYEASTEGADTYSPSIVDRGTVKDTIAGYTYGNDGSTTTAAQSNRIRGLSAPDAAINNFSTNNRIPLDAYNIQSIEISRGPNSLLFGLGTPSGVVNSNVSQAVLDRTRTTVNVRTDQNGSYRGSLSFNRPLIDGKLAMFGAVLYDNRQFERKPSRDLYRRQYGALTFKPFKNTVIRGFAEGYRNDANRPNFFTPRDQVTPWLQSGRPAYDPVTRTITIMDTGQVLGPYVSNTNSPGYDPAVNVRRGGSAISTVNDNPLYVAGIAADDNGRPIRLIDSGQVVDFFARSAGFYRPAQTNPQTALPSPGSLGWASGDPRYMILDRMWTSSTNLPTPTQTINGQTYNFGNYQWAGVTDKSIYDWTEYNTLQTNFAKVRAANYDLELEQQITPDLFFSAGWLRQDIDETDNYTLNQLTGATLSVDTNLKLPDGRPNPYFGLPFISEGVGGGLDTFYSPETDDNYRAMLAYNLDFTKNKNWTRWLGRHRLLGLWQEQDVLKAVERWRMNFVDGDDVAKLYYTRNLSLSGQAIWSNTAIMRKHYMASPGDPQNGSVTHSLGFYGNQGWDQPFVSNVELWNYQTGQYEPHEIVEELAFSNAGSFKTQREVEGTQFAIQSYLWGDRLVSTLGWRHDDYRARITTSGALTDEEGNTVEPPLGTEDLYLNGFTGLQNRDLIMNRWNRWDRLSGDTKTLGAALRPFHGFRFTRQLGGEGSVVSQFLDGLTFYYNQSDNFNPPSTFQTDMFFRPLPKPTGKGRDIGVGFNLFNNKLVARVNWYETESLNERTNAANLLLTRVQYPDTTLGIPWASAVLRIRNAMAAGQTLDEVISTDGWNTEAVNPIGDEANQRKIYDMLQLPYQYFNGLSRGATQDSKSKGVELQLTYNPTRNWTMKLTGSKNNATYTNIAPQYDGWFNLRYPIWTSLSANDIPDFTDPNTGTQYSLKSFWHGYGYSGNARIENTNGNTSTEAYYQATVESQVAIAKALEGAVSPLQRLYHAAFLTNYTFGNEAFDGRLKGFGLGGSLRWESKAAIGFYGKASNPNNPTILNLNDVTRPVYDDGNYYSDIWFSYTRRIFHDRVGMKIQLNVNNWMESGRLMPTQVNYDGQPWAFRIIDPRQYILQATFTF